MKPGGFYVVDDMLPQANWPDGHAAGYPVLTGASASEGDPIIVATIWASGIVVAVKRGRRTGESRDLYVAGAK